MSLGFVLKGYPRLSETFIAQEIHLLEKKGYEIEILSMRKAREKERQPIVSQIKAKVTYLPEYFNEDPTGLMLSLLVCFFRAPDRTLSALWHSITASISLRSKSPLKRFMQACWIVNKKIYREGAISHFHSHFLHAPTELTFYASRISQLKYSISAHAKDIYTISKSQIKERVNASELIMTCTSYNYQFLKAIPGIQKNKIHKVYHGVSLKDFKPKTSVPALQKGEPARLITVGRLVPKKGYEYILNALKILKDTGYSFSYEVFGSGELDHKLKSLTSDLGLDQQVTFHGNATQTTIIQRYQEKGIYVNGSVEAENGDRDGIPNTIAEAMSMEIPVVATNVSGIPELVKNEESGLLVPQRDSQALAIAISRLIDDKTWAYELGLHGRSQVDAIFNCEVCIQSCHDLLKQFRFKDSLKRMAYLKSAQSMLS